MFKSTQSVCSLKNNTHKLVGAGLTQVSRWAGTGSVESCALAVASVLAVRRQTGVLVDFTVSACTHTHRHTHALKTLGS